MPTRNPENYLILSGEFFSRSFCLKLLASDQAGVATSHFRILHLKHL
jgi:hypothetical protein